MYEQWQKFKWQITDEEKAAKKQQQLQDTYGYKFPIYKIQNPSGKEWFAMVYPKGLQPNPKRKR